MNTPGTTRQSHLSIEHEEGRAAPSGTGLTPHANRRAPRWSARRRHDAWFLLIVLLLGIGTIMTLSYGGAQHTGQTSGTRPETFPPTATTTSTTEGTPVPTARVLAETAQSHLYPFPQSNVGLMQPVVDARGNVWVGEMYANRLARFDSHTGVVSSWEAPNGKNGIMTTTIDAQGNAWFVEQGANYIGRFDPARQTFRIFPLGTVQGRPMGPQALQFDASGLLWFTAAAGGRIGRLDPATGMIQTWPVPPPRSDVLSAPFSLTVLPNGQVWFGDITGGAVGHLDPATGHVTLYHLADPQATIFSMAHDAKGRIWFTEILPGRLGMIDSTTGTITELPVPTVSGHLAALYGVVVAPGGDVWFANNGANALVRYAPGTATYTFFQLSTPSAGLYGLTLAPTGTLWFTASGSSTTYVGETKP
jgi:streptogramin lyase